MDNTRCVSNEILKPRILFPLYLTLVSTRIYLHRVLVLYSKTPTFRNSKTPPDDGVVLDRIKPIISMSSRYKVQFKFNIEKKFLYVITPLMTSIFSIDYIYTYH